MGSASIGFAFLGILGPPPNELETQSLLGVFRHGGIVNLAARGMLVVSVALRLGSEGPLLAYCVAPL
jgi:hypothetical protein